jgi:hypothetical protein
MLSTCLKEEAGNEGGSGRQVFKDPPQEGLGTAYYLDKVNQGYLGDRVMKFHAQNFALAAARKE